MGVGPVRAGAEGTLKRGVVALWARGGCFGALEKGRRMGLGGDWAFW